MTARAARARQDATEAREQAGEARVRVYVLFQTREMARRPHAQAFLRAWGYADAGCWGTDEGAARDAEVVLLVGSADFYPTETLPARRVYRVVPRSVDDPDDTEGVLWAIQSGAGELLAVMDTRAWARPDAQGAQETGSGEREEGEG